MDFALFLLDTAATTAAGTTGSIGLKEQLLSTALPLLLLLALSYFLLIRPGKKQQKQEKQMRENLQIGDEVVTNGGICGRIVNLKEDSVVIETGADRSKLRVKRWAIDINETIHDDDKK